MRLDVKRKAALAVVAAVLGMVGSAFAATPAFAYHINYGTNGTGGPVPVGTTYVVTSGTVQFLTASGGVIFQCPKSTLTGVTTGSGGLSSGLNVQASTTAGTSSFGPGCSSPVIGPITVTGNFSPPWQISVVGGGPSPPTPFTLQVTNVSVTVRCGSSAETFSGTLSNGVTWNNTSSGANITFNNAQSLAETSHVGSGCGIPGPLDFTGVYQFSTVGGSPGTFWLFN